MFAVIRTGGNQYRVAKDDVIAVEKLAGAPGDAVQFDEVLMLADGAATSIGTPRVEGARVLAEVVEQTRGPKIIVFKKKRRKNYRRKKGHRQDLTVVKITDIVATGETPKPATKAEATKKRKAVSEPLTKEKKDGSKAAPAKARGKAGGGGGRRKEGGKGAGAKKTAKAKK